RAASRKSGSGSSAAARLSASVGSTDEGKSISATCTGPPREWHLDLEKRSKMEKLGSYPICPDSRRERDLSAIRPPRRSILIPHLATGVSICRDRRSCVLARCQRSPREHLLGPSFSFLGFSGQCSMFLSQVYFACARIILGKG